jgi:hypothetical protein
MKRVTILLILVGFTVSLMGSPHLAGATDDFNPKTYTCKQFLQALEKDEADEFAAIALAFAYGYLCANTPKEADINPLNEEILGAMALTFKSICAEKGSMSFLDATKEMVKQIKVKEKTGKTGEKKK